MCEVLDVLTGFLCRMWVGRGWGAGKGAGRFRAPLSIDVRSMFDRCSIDVRRGAHVQKDHANI